MLSVQSVNFKPAFGHYDPRYGNVIDVDYTKVDDMPSDVYYSKEDYTNDKVQLEKQLEDINAVIENVQVPKPVRAFGKLVSVGIGAALGFVSMKYGAQGVVALMKKSYNWMRSLGKSKVVENAAPQLKKSGVFKGISEFFSNKAKKFNESGLGKRIADIKTTFKNYAPVKYVTKKGAEFKKAVSDFITPERIEKGTVNLFAVSGGVTGGVTALEEAAKD